MTEKLEKMRHTLSHVLAAAVTELYPTVKFGIGPAIDDGFYYDIDFGETKISDADLLKIEKKMRGIVVRKLAMKKLTLSREEALNWAKKHKQSYKTELINDLPEGEEISFYVMADKSYKDGLKIAFWLHQYANAILNNEDFNNKSQL